MENKLPKEFKDKWVASLRSKRYKQGVGKLSDGDGYCCLGVAGCVMGYQDTIIGKHFFSRVSFGDEIDNINIPDLLKGRKYRGN